MDYEKLSKKELITEIRKLSEKTRHYEVVFSASFDGIALIEVDSQKIQAANPALIRHLGYKENEITKLTLKDLIDPDIYDKVKNDLEDLLRGEASIARGIVCVNRIGIKLAFDIGSGLVTMAGNNYIVATFRDVTAKIRNDEYQKQLQNEYFHSSKLASIGELASGIAHEINNPLSIMRGYIDTLEDEVKEDPESLHEAVSVADECITRITSIISGVRAYAETRSIGNRNIDIHTIIQETINLIQGPYGLEHISLHKELHADNPVVLGNDGKIKHMLMNILSNAKDAMLGQRGTINIETANVLDSVIIKISDSGSGIDDKEISKLFDAFYTTKAPGHGLGLGLSITHSIIRDMKGIIDIESEPGEGTSVHVLIPSVTTKKHEKKPEKEYEKLNGKLLVVDDEETIRKIMVKNLSKFGLEVHEASDGHQAFTMIKEQFDQNREYQFVITDFNMPGMYGNELIEASHELGVKKTKFVIASATIFGEYTKEQRQKILKIADANIKKPFTRDDIYKILRFFM